MQLKRYCLNLFSKGDYQITYFNSYLKILFLIIARGAFGNQQYADPFNRNILRRQLHVY